MTLFYLTIAAELAFGVGLIVSIIRPARRVWPPGWRSRQFWFVWVLILFALVSIGVAALSNWNGFVFPNGLRYGVGAPLFGGGLVLAFSGVGRLDACNSVGLKGKLTTTGFYRYSRNPQYLSDVACLIGVILFSNASLVLLPGLLAALLFALWPFSEELWLKKRFGKELRALPRAHPGFLLSQEI